jgi:PAS domain
MLVTGVNQAAEKLFGISGEDMVGRHCHDVFRCAVCENDCGMLVGINDYDEGGEIEGAVATIKDITDEVAPQKREVIAESPGMRDVMNFARRVAASERAGDLSGPATQTTSLRSR